MQDKRIKSILAFSNPYSLYDVEELIDTLEKNEKEKGEKEKEKEKERGEEKIEKYEGYNVLKDNFREIKDWEEYNKRER